MEPTRPVVFQILPSLVVGGSERLVVHLMERLNRERFSARVHLFGVAAGHALRGAGAGIGRAALLSGQGRRARAGACCAN
jgi:hypothetical protein